MFLVTFNKKRLKIVNNLKKNYPLIKMLLFMMFCCHVELKNTKTREKKAILCLLIGNKFIFRLNCPKSNCFIAGSIWMTEPKKNCTFFSWVVLSLKSQQPIIAAITKFCWYYG